MLLMHLKLPASLVYALQIFCNSKFVTVFKKTNRLARKSIIAYARKYAFEQEDTNVKKCVLLVDKESDWLQIWTAASSLDVKGNKAIKKKFVFLANRFFFQNMVTFFNPVYDYSQFLLRMCLHLVI